MIRKWNVVGIHIKSVCLFRFISHNDETLLPEILLASNEHWLWQVLELERVHISSITNTACIWATVGPNVNLFSAIPRAVSCIWCCHCGLCHLWIVCHYQINWPEGFWDQQDLKKVCGDVFINEVIIFNRIHILNISNNTVLHEEGCNCYVVEVSCILALRSVKMIMADSMLREHVWVTSHNNTFYTGFSNW